jgi:hypothetical protein
VAGVEVDWEVEGLSEEEGVTKRKERGRYRLTTLLTQKFEYFDTRSMHRCAHEYLCRLKIGV